MWLYGEIGGEIGSSNVWHVCGGRVSTVRPSQPASALRFQHALPALALPLPLRSHRASTDMHVAQGHALALSARINVL